MANHRPLATFRPISLLLAVGFLALGGLPLASAGCGDAACASQDPGCSFLVRGGSFETHNEPWVWYVGYRDAEGNALVVYDRPSDCDNYGVAACVSHDCRYVAFLGFDNSKLTPEPGDIFSILPIDGLP